MQVSLTSTKYVIYYIVIAEIGGIALKIALGCDHAAFEMKAQVAEELKEKGIEVLDFGTSGPESVDYPDYAAEVCEAILSGKADRGVLICGTGIGMSMAANKHRGIRAALCSEPLSARFSRLHNDANVLCMGARMIGPNMAQEILTVWLKTPFESGRHLNRINIFSDTKSIEKDSC